MRESGGERRTPNEYYHIFGIYHISRATQHYIYLRATTTIPHYQYHRATYTTPRSSGAARTFYILYFFGVFWQAELAAAGAPASLALFTMAADEIATHPPSPDAICTFVLVG